MKRHICGGRLALTPSEFIGNSSFHALMERLETRTRRKITVGSYLVVVAILSVTLALQAPDRGVKYERRNRKEAETWCFKRDTPNIYIVAIQGVSMWPADLLM
jgi:hypothetical protein